MENDDPDEKPDDKGAENDANVDGHKRVEKSAKMKHGEHDSELEKAEDEYFKVIQAVNIRINTSFIDESKLHLLAIITYNIRVLYMSGSPETGHFGKSIFFLIFQIFVSLICAVH